MCSTNALPPSTCYIAAAMSAVPEDERAGARVKREAIAKFFKDAYQHTCSHYKVLLVAPEGIENEEEKGSIVARDFTLVFGADVFVLCYEGYFSWGAAAELGFAYASGKPIVIFNLTTASLPLFLDHLPEDPNHVKYIIASKDDLMYFVKDYKPECADSARKAARVLASVIYP